MEVVIAGAVIEDRRILLVDNNGYLCLPGGRLEKGESDLVCLAREFGEELSRTRIKADGARYHQSFRGRSPNRGVEIDTRVYLVDLDGSLGKPSECEIKKVMWMKYGDKQEHNLSSVTLRAVDSLHRHGYF